MLTQACAETPAWDAEGVVRTRASMAHQPRLPFGRGRAPSARGPLRAWAPCGLAYSAVTATRHGGRIFMSFVDEEA